MSGTEGRPARRLRLIRDASRTAPEPRVEALDALLRDVDDLRLTLETDLTLAAAAVESGSPEIAVEILDSDRRALAGFEERALGHLGELPKRRSWVPAHAAPFVAAAALIGLLAAVAPHALAPSPATTPVAASDNLERLQAYARAGDTDEVRAASLALHEQLAGVVANAKTDPEAAQTALLLLTYEQKALTLSSDSAALTDVLRRSQALALAIRAALPTTVHSSQPTVPAIQPAPSASPSAKPKASSSPSASPKASAKPSPSSSPKPSSSPTSAGPLPKPPVSP